MYRLGIYEAGYLGMKNVNVKLGNNNKYVNISQGAQLISSHPAIQHIIHHVGSTVAIYVLHGCDYVSSIYGYSKEFF